MRRVRYAGCAAAASALILLGAAAHGQNEADGAVRTYLAANGFLQRGLDELAAKEYRAFLGANPIHEKAPTARYGLAVALFRMDEHAAAAAELAHVTPVDAFEFAAESRLLAAQCALALGEADAAAATLGALVRSHPDHAVARDAAALLVEARYRAGSADGAGAAADAYLRRWPEGPQRDRVEFFRGLAEIGRGDHATAAATMAAILDRGPTSAFAPRAALLGAQCLHRLGRGNDARPLYQRALDSGDASVAPDALLGLATLARAGGELDAAAGLLDRLISQHAEAPNAAAARLERGRVRFERGDTRDAAKDLEWAESHAPELADHAAYWLAKCDIRNGKPSAAADRLGAALVKWPQSAIAAEMRYDRGAALSLAGDHAGAAKELAAFHAAHPVHALAPDALALRAQSERRAEDPESSLRSCLEFTGAHPGHPLAGSILLLTADNLLALGREADAAEALEAYVEVYAAEPGADGAGLRLGTLLYRLGDTERARPHLEKAAVLAEAETEFRPALLCLGDLLFHAGELERAAAVLDQYAGAEKKAASGDDALLKAAIALQRLDRPADALARLDALIAGWPRSPHRPRAELERGRLLVALDREKEAADALRSLLKSAKGSALAVYAATDLAGIETRAGRYAAAADALRTALEAAVAGGADLPPEVHGQALYRLGASEFERGEHRRSAEAFGEFLERFAGSGLAPSAALLAGDALMRIDRHEAAAGHLRRVAADFPESPQYPPALLRLGECAARLQDWAESERSFAAYLDRFADQEEWYQAAFGLAWAKENGGDAEGAIEVYRGVTDRHNGPTAARAQFQIGECLFALGRHEDAAAELLKVDILYAYPEWTAAALYEAGRCFEAMGDAPRAADHYRAVAERHGDTDWGRLARQRLAPARESRK